MDRQADGEVDGWMDVWWMCRWVCGRIGGHSDRWQMDCLDRQMDTLLQTDVEREGCSPGSRPPNPAQHHLCCRTHGGGGGRCCPGDSCSLWAPCRGEIWGKENTSSSGSESRARFRPGADVIAGLSPPCHHRTLPVWKFGAGKLPLLTPAAWWHQNEPNTSQRADPIYPFSWSGQSRLHPLGKGS